MYGEGEIRAHIRLAWEICGQADLGRAFNPGANYQSLGVAAVKAMSYQDEYLKYLNEGLYDIVLTDRSLVQFKFDATNPRAHLGYAYYENPFEVLDRDAFLAVGFGISVNEARALVETDPEIASYYDEEDAVSAATVKPCVMPIRYDYSPALYTAGVHPASHVHFGHKSNVRMATGRLMRPTSFMCLIVRQCYPDQWSRFIASDGGAGHCRQVHEHLDEVPAGYWGARDFFETGLDLPRERNRGAR
jgi:hypothetical protein